MFIYIQLVYSILNLDNIITFLILNIYLYRYVLIYTPLDPSHLFIYTYIH